MKIAVFSPEGDAPAWWFRLKDEGHEVRVWIGDSACKTIGDGLVTKAGQSPELVAWIKAAALAGPALALFDFSGLGETADALRAAGVPVICGGTFMDRLEKDRAYGFKIIEAAGAALPPYEEFASIPDAFKRAGEIGNCPTFFKSDRRLELDATHGEDDGPLMAKYLEGLHKKFGKGGACILQQKIEGVPISTTRWWNGMDWVGRYSADYENKKLMNGDIGPATGCSFNVTWFYPDEPEIARALHWDGLTPLFRQYEAPPGLYDINAIIAPDGQAFFLEWTPRLGYDSEMTNFALMPDLAKFLYDVATGHDPRDPSDDLAYSVRLTIPPYPWEKLKAFDAHACAGVKVENPDGLWSGQFIPYEVCQNDDGEIETVGCEGIIGLALAIGDSLSECHEEAIEYAKDLKLSGAALMYRTDGADDIKEKAEALVEAGYDIHEGLLT